MIEYKVLQGSPEWFGLRCGRPTASEFNRIITAKGRKPSKGMMRYIDEIIGIAAHAADGRFPPWVERYTTRSMDQGAETEAEARYWYTMETGLEARQVGFCTTDDGRFGCSPDGLVDPDGGLELKCPEPGTQMRRVREGGVPPEYLAQVHGCLIVTGRKWWDFLSYCHGLPKHYVRVEPDGFTDDLRACLEIFWGKYQEVLERLKVAV